MEESARLQRLLHVPVRRPPFCISNIRQGGLAIADAADAIVALVSTMLKPGVSGVGLHAAAAKLPVGESRHS
ncbi:MAG: ethanolamine ammonia-lyase light chain EutC [Bradyrhizobium sp.]|uniref:ethanolamine ammonia-lyase light chain EutC n=1 Tax=Bradyrhizobium sp. TaxID=376 RepID=UPI001A305C91|nr:ethanolamine ammonia-lyase light chain EutC [Bradyrhizobium sp.]MBJ7402747.1 ethanolamine ammonia-lyase light chain EutC [Bradyrhizobium sp.]